MSTLCILHTPFHLVSTLFQTCLCFTTLTCCHITIHTLQITRYHQHSHKKYAGVASRLGAELLNLSVDTFGGVASHAVKLVEAIGEEGERWSAGTWSSGHIRRMLLSSTAVAVQRGDAMVMLSGFTRSASARVGSGRRAGRKSERETVTGGVERQTVEEETKRMEWVRGDGPRRRLRQVLCLFHVGR